MVDLCCGSGNLACAIASHFPSLRVWACDLLPAAVELTRRNAEALGVAARVTVLQGDLLAPLADQGLEGTLDALVCNPPYISTGRLAGDRSSLLRHEPREAFDGGPYGLTIHQRVAREAGPLLRPGAPLLMEIGAGQDQQVLRLLDRAGGWHASEVRRDACGVPRVVVAYRSGIRGGP
jgi:release factor glutamine methyltransferase